MLIRCQEKPRSDNILLEGSDSLTTAQSYSPIRSDPWINYSYIERQGRQLFNQYCDICHGNRGEGDGFNAYNLDPRPHSLADSVYMRALTDESLTEIITFGGRGVNKSIMMPAYQNTLSKMQISDVVAYIRTFVEQD